MITLADLEEFGMTRPVDPEEAAFYPLSKRLTDLEDDQNFMDLCLNRVNVQDGLSLEIVVDGDSMGSLNLNGAETIEDLRTIEKCITGFEPPY